MNPEQRFYAILNFLHPRYWPAAKEIWRSTEYITTVLARHKINYYVFVAAWDASCKAASMAPLRFRRIRDKNKYGWAMD